MDTDVYVCNVIKLVLRYRSKLFIKFLFYFYVCIHLHTDAVSQSVYTCQSALRGEILNGYTMLISAVAKCQ